jgi:hypothetical protein
LNDVIGMQQLQLYLLIQKNPEWLTRSGYATEEKNDVNDC